MKLITAIIQPDKLDEVREGLIEAGITRITVSRCTGHGQAESVEIYRGQRVVPSLIPKARLEIAVNDDFVEPTIEVILSSTRGVDGGTVGDGKIFVTPLEECVRIRTGERGSSAV